MINIDDFISEKVIWRKQSLFIDDINENQERLYQNINNRSVLVIGGAGSIGSSFIKAILQYHPSELVIVDINENALTELTRDLRCSDIYIPEIYLSYPMDYSSKTFQRMFCNHKRSNGENGFDIVANFSAHKHVRSEKDIYSIEALLRNNVINAKNLMDLLENNPPIVYFCVSTDKAANPVNIMGASKRIMEDLIFCYSDAFPVKTARFANVAFSNGSLPQGFLERINRHQPLSAPTDTRRYFVSPEESGQICMLAAVLGDNREIYFPKLEKESMQTFDKIAEELLKSMGYDVDYCNSDVEAINKSKEWAVNKPYPVHFSVSDTSGEKGYEEFYIQGEEIDLKTYKSLGIIKGKNKPEKKRVLDFVDNLDRLFDSGPSKEDVVSIIKSYLPNFEHIETGKSLDNKM